jgi:hypothetical protein
MTENEKHIENNTEDPKPKTSYNSPQLVVYGDIREITLASKLGEAMDNAKPGQNLNMTNFPPRPTPSPKTTPQTEK